MWRYHKVSNELLGSTYICKQLSYRLYQVPPLPVPPFKWCTPLLCSSVIRIIALLTAMISSKLEFQILSEEEGGGEDIFIDFLKLVSRTLRRKIVPLKSDLVWIEETRIGYQKHKEKQTTLSHSGTLFV